MSTINEVKEAVAAMEEGTQFYFSNDEAITWTKDEADNAHSLHMNELYGLEATALPLFRDDDTETGRGSDDYGQIVRGQAPQQPAEVDPFTAFLIALGE